MRLPQTIQRALAAIDGLSPEVREELIRLGQRVASDRNLWPYVGAADRKEDPQPYGLHPSSQLVRELSHLLWGNPPLVAASATMTAVGSVTAGASVSIPPSNQPIWASPQSVALAAWLTVLLTLIGLVFTAKAALEAPAPVHVVVVSPSITRPSAP